jgi:hypothetical protein
LGAKETTTRPTFAFYLINCFIALRFENLRGWRKMMTLNKESRTCLGKLSSALCNQFALLTNWAFASSFYRETFHRIKP